MLSLRKLFKFPGPSAFNKDASDYALQSREFSPEVSKDVYCWEDYYEDLKKTYPIRYFFAETLADFLKYKVWNRAVRPFKDAWYWVKCHTFTKHKYHLIDIRQPTGDCDNYTHGWLDTDTRLLYAAFNLLNDFVKYEMDNFYCPTLEECEDKDFGPSNKVQREAYLAARELHTWWIHDRKVARMHINILQDRWYQRKHKCKKFDDLTEQFWTEYMEAKDQFDKKEDEMLLWLVKIRKHLWT